METAASHVPSLSKKRRSKSRNLLLGTWSVHEQAWRTFLQSSECSTEACEIEAGPDGPTTYDKLTPRDLATQFDPDLPADYGPVH